MWRDFLARAQVVHPSSYLWVVVFRVQRLRAPAVVASGISAIVKSPSYFLPMDLTIVGGLLKHRRSVPTPANGEE